MRADSLVEEHRQAVKCTGKIKMLDDGRYGYI